MVVYSTWHAIERYKSIKTWQCPGLRVARSMAWLNSKRCDRRPILANKIQELKDLRGLWKHQTPKATLKESPVIIAFMVFSHAVGLKNSEGLKCPCYLCLCSAATCCRNHAKILEKTTKNWKIRNVSDLTATLSGSSIDLPKYCKEWEAYGWRLSEAKCCPHPIPLPRPVGCVPGLPKFQARWFGLTL